MAVLDDLAQYAVDGGFGTLLSPSNPDGDIAKGFFPDSPPNCLVLEHYGGRVGDYVQETPNPDIEYPRIQVRVRNTAYDVGQTIAQALYLYFGAVSNQRINGTWYQRIIPQTPPYRLALDANARHHLAFNVEARKGLDS